MTEPTTAAHPFTPKVDVPSVCSVCGHTLGTDAHQPATAAHQTFRTNDGARCFTDCPACRGERLTKPAKAHNPLFAPATCLCVECSRWVLAQRCPKTTINPHLTDSRQQCGDWKGHKGDHTLLIATTFLIADERVRLDG